VKVAAEFSAVIFLKYFKFPIDFCTTILKIWYNLEKCEGEM